MNPERIDERADATSRSHVRPTLRFFTCGSVDDGKSTLIGRLLHDRNILFDDHQAALKRDSRRYGTTGDDPDYALLLDGLEAEREQGITIDVAYRYFSTPARAFIVADTPGHEQYTRNMATGASNADLAVLLVDVRKGLVQQTFRHATIVSLLGIRHVILAINKMDLVQFDESAFRSVADAFVPLARRFQFASVTPIPLSARFGDNVVASSPAMPWYVGPSLIDCLETIDVEPDVGQAPLRLPIQWVNRPNAEFRGYAGTLTSGSVAVGDTVVVAASGRNTRIVRIIGSDRDQGTAAASEAVTVVFSDDIDAARGDILCKPQDAPQVADQFAAQLIWMSEQPLLPGRSYLLKCGGQTVPATITDIKHKLDVIADSEIATKTLAFNENGLCDIATAGAIAFDSYERSRLTGSFILIDRSTNETVAAGLIRSALQRARNITLQPLTVTPVVRAQMKGQKPAVLWFTGLSGAGKSTIANLVEAKLVARFAHTTLLDGDNIRHGLNRDLGFTEGDRVENIRRIGEVAKLMTDAGLVVLCSFISPYRAERRFVRELFADGDFAEIFIDTPLDVCIARDPKGLYKRAIAGEIRDFTGIGQPYQRPEHPEITLTTDRPAGDLADTVVEWLVSRGHVT